MSENIKTIVAELVEQHGTRDLKKLCKRLKIDVTFIDLGTMKGYFKNCIGRKMIMINENLSEVVKMIVLAHEIGHAILHSDRDIGFLKENFLLYSDKIENEANKFAAEILIDENNLDDFYMTYKDDLEKEYIDRLIEIKFSK